jgi:hypothetical protein
MIAHAKYSFLRQGSVSMQKSNDNLLIQIKDIKDLFIAPVQDALSDYEYIQNGEAALTYIIQYIDPKKFKAISTINIETPVLINPEMNIDKIRHNIHHYLNSKMKENHKKLIIFKHNTTRIFRNAIIFLIICMAIVTILGLESFLPNMPPLMRSVLVEGFTVIGWVVMWRPIELILNQWTTFNLENKIYQTLLEANIELNRLD